MLTSRVGSRKFFSWQSIMNGNLKRLFRVAAFTLEKVKNIFNEFGLIRYYLELILQGEPHT